MEYILVHKKLVILYLLILAAIPVGFYLWKNQKPQPGSCLVLEEKYCINFRTLRNPQDPKGLLAAVKVPAGAVLFSPVEGMFSDTPTYFFEDRRTKQIIKYPGANIIISSDGTSKTVKEIFSIIYYKDKVNKGSSATNFPAVKRGDVIGTVSDQNIDFFGDYNLVIGITNQKLSEGEVVFTSANDKLKAILKKQ